MKLEELDLGMVVLFALIVAITVTAVTYIVVRNHVDCVAMERGYTQTMLPGCTCPVWVKNDFRESPRD